MSCLMVFFLFIQSHQNAKLGWILGNGTEWAYVWAEHNVKGKRMINYFAFNHIPSDSRVQVRQSGTCTLVNGKSVKVLEFIGEKK